jgi:hypothetical protein
MNGHMNGYWRRFLDWCGDRSIPNWSPKLQGATGVDWDGPVSWCKLFAYRQKSAGQWGVLVRLTTDHGREVWERIEATGGLPPDARLSSFPNDRSRPRWNIVISLRTGEFEMRDEVEQFFWLLEKTQTLATFIEAHLWPVSEAGSIGN